MDWITAERFGSVPAAEAHTQPRSLRMPRVWDPAEWWEIEARRAVLMGREPSRESVQAREAAKNGTDTGGEASAAGDGARVRPVRIDDGSGETGADLRVVR